MNRLSVWWKERAIKHLMTECVLSGFAYRLVSSNEGQLFVLSSEVYVHHIHTVQMVIIHLMRSWGV